MPHLIQIILKELKPIEIIAAITSLLCVYLTVKNNIWNWFWGIIGVCLYGYIFVNQKLYANAGLQIIYFLPMQFLGWYIWLKGNPKEDNALAITTVSNKMRAGLTLGTLALTAAIYYGMPPLITALGLPAPQLTFWDGFTTAISITAQYLQTYKKFENWILWILVDIIYTLYLFPTAHLYVTTVLYAVFTFLAITGAVEWWRLMGKAKMEAPELSTAVHLPVSPSESDRPDLV